MGFMNGMAAAFSLFSLFILYCAPTKANPQQGFLPKLDPNKLTQDELIESVHTFERRNVPFTSTVKEQHHPLYTHQAASGQTMKIQYGNIQHTRAKQVPRSQKNEKYKRKNNYQRYEPRDPPVRYISHKHHSKRTTGDNSNFI